MPAIYHEGSWLGNATDPEVLVKDTVGWTGKNRLDFIPHQKSVNNGTITIESDGTVVVNGTFSAQSTARYDTEEGSSGSATAVNTSVPNYDCIASFGGNSNVGFTIGYFKSDDTIVDTLKTVRGSQENISFPSDAKKIRCYIVVAAGTYSNAKFYPMLRDASISDSTYEPYHESVEVMYEEEIHGVNLLKTVREEIIGRGMTITRNSDNSYTFNGTASTEVGYVSINNRTVNLGAQARLKNGSYKMSGFPAGTTSPNVYMIATITKNGQRTVLAEIYGNSTDKEPTFIVNGDDYGSDGAQVNLSMYVDAGYAVTNLVFKPMLRKAEIDDPTYRPYNPQAIQNQLNAQGVLGAKNLLKYPYVYTTRTVNGMTYTDLGNGAVRATSEGATTGNADFHFAYFNESTLPKGKYYLSDGGASTNSVRIMVNKHNGSTYLSQLVAMDANHHDVEIDVDYDGYTDIRVLIWASTGATANNLTFYPMLRLASDPDDTYQPYAMTNRELTEKVFEKRDLTSADNLNNVTETGIYGITTQPSNSPISYATLIVNRRSDNGVSQLIQKSDSMYTRAYGGNPSAWTSWYKFTGTVVS